MTTRGYTPCVKRTNCRKTAKDIWSPTLAFLLLNWKIPRRPFFSALPKLVVLEQMESTNGNQRGRGGGEEYEMIVSVPC